MVIIECFQYTGKSGISGATSVRFLFAAIKIIKSLGRTSYSQKKKKKNREAVRYEKYEKFIKSSMEERKWKRGDEIILKHFLASQ